MEAFADPTGVVPCGCVPATRAQWHVRSAWNHECIAAPSTASAVRRPARATQRRVLAPAAALVVVAGFVMWLGLRDHGRPGASSAQGAARIVSAARIRNLASSLGHPVFWLGAKSRYRYELSRPANGTIYVRYLPAGVPAGSSKPYLTVATYPFSGAYTAIHAVSKQHGSMSIKLASGGLAVLSATHPETIHVAFPGVDYQVEVYDPILGAASALVASGDLVAAGGLKRGANASARKALSAADLRAYAHSLGHPLYWVGAMQGYRYEVTKTSSGQIYVRYLARGVAAGSPQARLTVGTYPFPGAFKAVQALGRERGATTFRLARRGLAVVERSYPKSIHLAFPGSGYQIEVFDPDPAVARKLVSRGRVSTVR